MATKKPRSAKKQSIKPEAIIRATPKRRIAAPKPPQKKPTKKQRRVHIPLRAFLHKRVKKPIFYSIVACFVAIVSVVTFMQVRTAVTNTSDLLAAASQRANDSFLFAKKEADLVRIIGTKLERRSEIVNYQSAPADLRAFADADYRSFKANCITDKKIVGTVRYKIENVPYDSFARITRTCNGGTDTVLLKKFDTWAVIFSGNVQPPCTLTNDLDVPQGIAYYCTYDGISYINPNP